ncbi:MAG TPA: hypothetical protein VHU89_17130 [Acidobacteriaceae bacterium]|jgi:hypothetical protein|nr:hypothetical protein [Acidobacteriaceae bacterium]
MNVIRFYRRYDPDGRCKVICMQCFQTLGTAWDRHSLEEMEAAHLCASPLPAARRPGREVRPEMPLLREALHMHVGVLVGLTVLALYLLPTALEFAASYAVNPWLAVILPGDLIGCAVLVGLLRMPRTGVLLYVLLTVAEALSYAANGAVVPDLRWLTDSIPTLLVVSLVLRMKLRSRELAVS